MNTEDYISEIMLDYLEYIKEEGMEDNKEARIMYIAEIFITSYNSEATFRIGIDIVIVLKAIVTGKVWDMDETYYTRNVQYLLNIINWGTSIRGAFIEETKILSYHTEITLNKEVVVQLLEWIGGVRNGYSIPQEEVCYDR